MSKDIITIKEIVDFESCIKYIPTRILKDILNEIVEELDKRVDEAKDSSTNQ